VEVYAELANQLFKNLFGVALIEHVTPSADLLGQFMEAWLALERDLAQAARSGAEGARPRGLIDAARFLAAAGVISDAQLVEIDSLRKIRNEALHGVADHRLVITPAVVDRVRDLANIFRHEKPH
jgi:hypothetical protein